MVRKTIETILILGLVVTSTASIGAPARGDEVENLIAEAGFEAWSGSPGVWTHAQSVSVDSRNPKRLAYEPGKGGIIVNGPIGRAKNLISKASFGDVDVHLEFVVPKGSNSGIKFEGVYEIQIADSYGVAKPTASDCGGIYPRAELLPKYHHIDKGIPPRVNASKAPGEWQTLDVVFHAPRFDAGGQKIASARIVKATLNGQVIHENVELKTPTGNAWHDDEKPAGPILLQGDHGPCAFRNLRVTPISSSS